MPNLSCKGFTYFSESGLFCLFGNFDGTALTAFDEVYGVKVMI